MNSPNNKNPQVFPSFYLLCFAPISLLQMRNVIFGAFVGFMLGTFFGLSSIKYGLVVRAPVIEVAENEPIEAIKTSNQNETEQLPSGIAASTTDLFLRRLWGHPDEDLPFKPKYLVTFTVGLNQKDLVNTAVSKFSKNWTIVLFHYDGRVNEWEEFEWSHRAIHISARKQSKWWFAKRFLHPDVVSPFEYIFVWDEDLDLDHFDAEEYINLVKKHGLEISQPGLEPYKLVQWQLTQRLENSEVHRVVKEGPNVCPDPLKPPCAGFVEIMAPVFSRSSWHCVWRLIQNDLVHGWGLDFFMGRCVEMAHEKIGVVDAQYIRHKSVPSLGNQGESIGSKAPWEGVRERCYSELEEFRKRMRDADLGSVDGQAISPNDQIV